MTSYSYNKLKDLKVDDVFYDCSSKISVKYIVVREPIETYSDELEKNQLEWFAVVAGEDDGDRFLVTEGLEHYGPSIYSYPAYTNPNEFKQGIK